MVFSDFEWFVFVRGYGVCVCAYECVVCFACICAYVGSCFSITHIASLCKYAVSEIQAMKSYTEFVWFLVIIYH